MQLLTTALKLWVNVCHYITATFSPFHAQFCFRLKPPAFEYICNFATEVQHNIPRDDTANCF